MTNIEKQLVTVIAMFAFSTAPSLVANVCPGKNIEPEGFCVITPAEGGCDGGQCISPWYSSRGGGSYTIYVINSPPETSGPCGAPFSTSFNIPVTKHVAQTKGGCTQSGFKACSYFASPGSFSCTTTGCTEWCSTISGLISGVIALFN